MPTLRLATRGSLLARTQSQLVADLLAPHLPPGATIELLPITTTGDRLSASLASPPNPPTPQLSALNLQHSPPTFDKGLFTKELDEALLSGAADFAVHSAKDLPTHRPPGLLLAATPPREDPRDVWIAKDALTPEKLPPGATVGTTSLRRRAQLLARRPDLAVIPLRGNIDTRLRKVAAGADGIVATFLAAAGLHRTGLLPPTALPLPTDQFIPAAGQGTLAIECRADHANLRALLAYIHDPIAFACLTFERRLIADLAGSCLAPIGVIAAPRGIVADQRQPGYLVRAIVATPDGQHSARAALLTPDDHPDALHALSPLLLRTLESRGAREILAPSSPPPPPRQTENAP
jgi:hydroxymethylbilane synthase